jgi:phage shock protein C
VSRSATWARLWAISPTIRRVGASRERPGVAAFHAKQHFRGCGLALRCPQMAAQLTRSKTDRVIAGVAGGIAERFGLDPTLVRIAWVVSIFFGGFGILLYVVLWIALPTGPSQSSAIRIAEERYARGEISTEELRRIRGDLQSSA